MTEETVQVDCPECDFVKVFTRRNSFLGNVQKSARKSAAGHKSRTGHVAEIDTAKSL